MLYIGITGCSGYIKYDSAFFNLYFFERKRSTKLFLLEYFDVGIKGHLNRLIDKVKYPPSEQMRFENTKLRFLNSYKIKWSRKGTMKGKNQMKNVDEKCRDGNTYLSCGEFRQYG